jgi:hypothetical protein
MPPSLPYLASYKNVGTLFERIASAKVPDALTHGFLMETLGLKASGDRPLITLLKSMGFVDQAGKPTPEYAKLKNKQLAKGAIADGIRFAYAPLFKANENAHALDGEALKGLIAQVAGTDEGATLKIFYTLNALFKVADFNATARAPAVDAAEEDAQKEESGVNGAVKAGAKPFRSDFHFNIQIHLPSNATEETYINIFSAVRKTFQ